jgi:hypothetical protein
MLVIRTDKNNSETFSPMDIPKAIFIPDDYKRKFDKIQNSSFENHQTQRSTQYNTEAVEEIKPVKNEKKVFKQERHDDYNTEVKPVVNNVQVTIKKESIIPSAFASTKRTYHLARKPRTSNSNLR